MIADWNYNNRLKNSSSKESCKSRYCTVLHGLLAIVLCAVLEVTILVAAAFSSAADDLESALKVVMAPYSTCKTREEVV